MKDARVVDGRCLERDGKRLVLIFICKPHEWRAGLIVAHHHGPAVDFGQVLYAFDPKTVQRIAYMKVARGLVGRIGHNSTFLIVFDGSNCTRAVCPLSDEGMLFCLWGTQGGYDV